MFRLIDRRTVLALAALALSAAAAAAEPILPVAPKPRPSLAQQMAGLRSDALKAYASGNYALYLSSLREMDKRLPNHPDITLRLAAAQARTGHDAEALQTLDALAGMGVTIDFKADERNEADFKSIASRPEFQRWLERMQANAEPKIASRAWHTFADAGLLAEDISYSPREAAFYVSSVLQHRIVRVDREGRESSFPLEAPEKDWNVLGLAVDPARGVLWVSAQAMRDFPGISAKDAGKARLSAYGLKSRRRLYSHEFQPKDGRQAAIGDLALAPNSDLLASDAEQARLYRVGAERKFIDVLEQPFFSPQDVAITPDGKVALVADYPRGIARIDLETGLETPVTAPRDVALAGIDGLYVHGNGLIAVQNGIRPPRIALLHLSPDWSRVTGLDALERGDELGEPTHGAIVGDEFVYIANSGWNHLDAKGGVKPGETLTAPVLRKLKLVAAPQKRPREVAPGVSLLRGEFPEGEQPDGNSVLFDAPQGLVVMDTGRHAGHAQAILDFAAHRARPIAAVVNSHWHLDHVSGNPAVRRAYPDVKVYASDAIRGALSGFLARYRTQLQELIAKNDARQQAFREEVTRIDAGQALAPDEVIASSGKRSIAGKEFLVGLEKRAATAGDVWLLDPVTRTLAAGDLVTLPAPFLDTACASGWQAALGHLDSAGFERLVPGHGAPMDRAGFRSYRQAFDQLLRCAKSGASEAECAAGWVKDAGTLLSAPDRSRAQQMVGYYVANRLRGEGAEADCLS